MADLCRTIAVRVPGPPKSRRRQVVGDIADRVEAMRRAELRSSSTAGVLLRLVRDVILLLKDLVVDPRVPRRVKVLAAVGLAYLVSPVDLVPDVIPVLGQVDDILVALLVLRGLIGAAGYEVIYDLWSGSEMGLALVLTLAGVEE